MPPLCFVGNPHNEAHGRDMLIHRHIAPGDTDVEEIIEELEKETGLKLYGRGDGSPVYGYVHPRAFMNAAGEVEGYEVDLVLYLESCDNAKCPTGHGEVRANRSERRRATKTGAPVREQPATPHAVAPKAVHDKVRGRKLKLREHESLDVLTVMAALANPSP